MKSFSTSITIAELKYLKETHSLVFLFDKNSGHTAFANDALNVNRMNVNPGGAQPQLRDTIWNGRSQRMVFTDSTPKGMRQVLNERGVDTRRKKAADMREALKRDARFQRNILKVMEELRKTHQLPLQCSDGFGSKVMMGKRSWWSSTMMSLSTTPTRGRRGCGPRRIILHFCQELK